MEASTVFDAFEKISKKHISDPEIYSHCPVCSCKEILLNPNQSSRGYYIWKCNLCGYHWYK